METLKEKAVTAISSLPDTADIDDIMYRLYVINKVLKGKVAVDQGNVISIAELEKEMETW